jgi:hypothetical protein
LRTAVVQVARRKLGELIVSGPDASYVPGIPSQ